MGLINRFLDDMKVGALNEVRSRISFLEQDLQAKLKRMEGRLMSALEDKIAELEASFDATHEAIAAEIAQLAASVAEKAPDLSPAVARLQTLIDRSKADAAALAADDPVAAAVVDPAPVAPAAQ